MIAFIRSIAAVVLGVCLSPSSRGADPTDPAELFPPGTLAYAEIHDPANVGPQIAAALKGSAIEDSIAFIHTRRDKAKDPRDLLAKEHLAILGLLASPEMATEFKRLRGVGVGVVGISEQRELEVALAVLTGESAAAGLTARAFLTMTSVRKVGAVGDVAVYQFRQPTLGYDPSGRQVLQNEKPPTEGAHEATFAYLPGLFVAGTSKFAVGEVIARFQGKVKGSLADQPAFKAAAATHRQPGLFFYANVADYFAKFDAMKKKAEVAADVEADSIGWFKLLVNAKAVRTVAGCVRFRDGGLALNLAATFDPAHKSPLLELLSGTGARIELLRSAPTPATFALAISFPEKNRAAAVVGFLDALAKANGELGRTPGEAIKELEAKFKIAITETLIGKIAGATIVLPVRQELPKGAVALPLVVLHTEGESVAAGWEDLLPKVIGDLSGVEPLQTSSEMVGGLKVLTVPAGNLPWKSAVHYARKGSDFALGLDRKLVASLLNGDAGKSVALPEKDSAVGLLGVGGVIRLLTEVKPVSGPVVPRGPAGPVKPTPGFGDGLRFSEHVPTIPDGSPQPENQQKEEAAARSTRRSRLWTRCLRCRWRSGARATNCDSTCSSRRFTLAVSCRW